ncbi:PaaI family thioesterase [Streptomyces sp. NPDC020490]|uniref:PaaI family thioesterase n=1 Tax=Streptomyces sp. NPDC020490 TaxID=3365078 RepID=UPI0037A72BCF
MLDSAAGRAVHSTLPAGGGYTSMDLTVKFLRAMTVETGKVRAVGTVVHGGRRSAMAQAALYASSDRPLVRATGGCLIVPATNRPSSRS